MTLLLSTGSLVSALSGVPLRQDVAVTGSVDRHGCEQAAGGINEKTRGFSAACRDNGPTGTQGVVIPAANVADLMLDREVVDAVGAYPQETVNGRAQRDGHELGEATTARALRMA